MIASILLLIITLISSLLVLFLNNPIHMLLFLLLIFLLAAISWISLNAEFLGFMLIILYAGAINILFLFVIMMLDQHATLRKIKLKKYQIISITIATILGVILTNICKDYNFIVTTNTANYIELLSKSLLEQHMLLIIVSGVLLLTTMIAIIILKDYKETTAKLDRL